MSESEREEVEERKSLHPREASLCNSDRTTSRSPSSSAGSASPAPIHLTRAVNLTPFSPPPPPPPLSQSSTQQ